MHDDMLQVWVERVSLEHFHLPFRHQATFNRRLTVNRRALFHENT